MRIELEIDTFFYRTYYYLLCLCIECFTFGINTASLFCKESGQIVGSKNEEEEIFSNDNQFYFASIETFSMINSSIRKLLTAQFVY